MNGIRELTECCISRGRARTDSLERGRKMRYDLHLSVHFDAELDRRAHVYIGRPIAGKKLDYTREEIMKMGIWRREGKPAIVLC